MLVIIFNFLEFLPFVLGFFYLFIVNCFCVPVEVLLILIRVVNVLLAVIVVAVIESIAIKGFKENPFQNIPHKENNNGCKY